MDLEIVPALCKPTIDADGAEVAPSFSGSVTIKIPSMPASYRFKAKHGKKAMELEQHKAKPKPKETADEKKHRETMDMFLMMDFLADVAEEIQPYFVKADLVNIKTNKSYKTVDELYMNEELFPIISEMAMKFIQGFATKD
jgi:hypothetical protein